MKYSELKNRFKNKYVIRIVAGVLTIAMLGTGYGAYSVSAAKATDGESVVSTEESTETADTDEVKKELEDKLGSMISDQGQSDIGKEETVYMIADANGNVNSTIVSDWLINKDNEDTLEDASDLKDITNVKGDEEFTQDGNKLSWAANGSDIFYQGTTDKESPISEKVTYFLDGEEIAADELAGKSGKVTIRFDYTNNEKTTTTIDGKKTDIYVPFSVMTGMVLDNSFSNVEVTNGKIISDGKNNIVVGIAMPGLQDSLGVDADDFDTDVEFPDYVEVTADVEDFELETTVTVATSNLMSELSMNGDLDLSFLSDTIDEMTDASTQLVDGSSKLSDGIKTLKDGIDSYTSGASTIDGYMKQLNDGTATLAAKVPTLTDGVSKLKDGSDSAVAGAATLNSGAKTAADGAETLNAAFIGKKGVAAGTKTLNTGIQKLSSGLKSMLTTVGTNATNYTNAKTALYANDDAANKALTDDLTAYVTAQVAYQNYGRALLDIQTAIQGTLASSKETATASITTINTGMHAAGQDTLMINLDPSVLALGNYVSFNDKTGVYTVQDGFQTALTTLSGACTGAKSEISSKRTATETARNTMVAADTAAAGAYATAIASMSETIGAEKAMEESFGSSSSQLAAYATQVGTVVSQYNSAAATMQAAYAKLTSQDAANPGTIVKVCTYYGDKGASEALNSVMSGLTDAGLDAAALTTLANGSNDINAAINGGTLSDGTKVETGIAAGTAALTQGLKGYDKQDGTHVTGLYEGTTSLLTGLKTINTGLTTLNDSTPALATGVSTLNSSVAQLKTGADTLVSNNAKLTSGVTELLEGSVTLADGMEEFDEQAIEKLADTYNGDVKSLLDRVDAVMQAGEDYTTFSDVAEGVNGSVKFIIRTDAVKAE